MMSADVDIKTLVGRPMTFTAKVPFAGKKCLVTMLLQLLGNGYLLVREVVTVLRVQHGVIGVIALAGDPVGDVHTHGMPASHNARARGAAHGAGSVALGEAHAAGRQPIYIGCLVKFTAIGPDIGPTHVINQKEQEIGLLGSVRIKETTKDTKKNKGAKQGAHAHEDTLQGRRWQWPVN